MGVLFSVCICTRNRADLLIRALDDLFKQILSSTLYEVLVINNASTDHTEQMVVDYTHKVKNLHLANEPSIGLSAARNRGASEAKGEWLAYLDDDALPPAEWLEWSAEIINSRSPDLFGGPFYPFYTTPKPAWFKEEYGTGENGKIARWMAADEFLFGGNLFVRRNLVLESGGFDLELGPHGEQLFFGDETAFQRKLRKSNPDLRVYYAPQLAVRHWVAPYKMRISGRMTQRWVEGRSGYLAFRREGDRVRPIHAAGFLAMPAVILWRGTVGALLRSRKRFPTWQNYYYESVADGVAVWGKLYQRIQSNWFSKVPGE